ncbi:Phage protein [Proteus mirabilis]
MYLFRGQFRLTEKSLDKQKLFWVALIIPFFSFLYFGIPIWINYSIDISTNGYEHFLKISILPLYILASAPVLAAFVANTHRTIQTAKQIIETEKKNKVDTVFSKFNFTCERLSKINLLDGRKIVSFDSIILLFFHFKDNELYIRKKIINELLSKFHTIIKSKNEIEIEIDSINNSCEENEIPILWDKIYKNINDINNNYLYICMRLGIYLDDDLESQHRSMFKGAINIKLEHILGDSGRTKAHIETYINIFIHDFKKIIDILSIIDERVKNDFDEIFIINGHYMS